jgi:hypothetical protein
MVTAYQLGKPVRVMGGFFAMALDGALLTFRPPFA